MDITKVLIEFAITFVIIYIAYYFLVVRKCKKNNKLVSSEVNIILILHKIDSSKIDVYQMVKVVSIVTTIILATIITLISTFFDNKWIIMLFGTLISLVVAVICYRIIGNYYKKCSLEKK